MRDFTDQKERLRRIVENAISGCTFEGASSEQAGRQLLLRARRPDGTIANLRFRGVQNSVSSAQAAQGSPLSLRGVGSGARFSLLRLLLPVIFRPGDSAWRVRIDAGEARLDIVCQDAEWWQEEGDAGR